MKKIMLTLLVAILALSSFTVKPVPPNTPFGIAFGGGLYPPGQYGIQVQTLNFGVESSQPTGLFLPPETYTASGSFPSPSGILTFGGYWVNPPSLISPLKLTIGPGYTATVTNTWFDKDTRVRLAVLMAAPNGGAPTVVYGEYQTIPKQGTGTLKVPMATATYTAALPTLYTDPQYPAYPIPVEIFVTD